jgi:hypothetical protein
MRKSPKKTKKKYKKCDVNARMQMRSDDGFWQEVQMQMT